MWGVGGEKDGIAEKFCIRQISFFLMGSGAEVRLWTRGATRQFGPSVFAMAETSYHLAV